MDQTSTALRPLLLSIAYRMLGSFRDAEDVVQEAYLRLHRGLIEVDSPKAFLTTVTTRLAIDQLRSARRQREVYVGPWLPEPAVDEYVDLSDEAARRQREVYVGPWLPEPAVDEYVDLSDEAARRQREVYVGPWLPEPAVDEYVDLSDEAARRQREVYVGPWLPEPAVDEYVDLSDEAARSDSLTTAFLVVLERLSPDQRAVFLLRDVFGYSYEEIAGILAKSQAAVRQLAVRARRQLEDGRPRFDPSRQERDELARRFVAACSDGELDGLIEFLAPEATFTGDGGGRATGLPHPVVGAVKVARLLIGAFGKLRDHGTQIEHVHVGGHPALRMHGPTDETIAVWSLLITDGTIVAIHGVVNPDKLTHL